MKFTKFFSMIIGLTFAGNCVNGQSLSPQSVNSIGANMEQSNGSLLFTVGDLVVEPQTDADGNTLSGGFGNTSGATVSVEDLLLENVGLSVYPNPTNDFVFLEFTETPKQDLTLGITDLNGRLVRQQIIPKGLTKIRLTTTDLSNGAYLINLTGKDNSAQASFKLIKTN